MNSDTQASTLDYVTTARSLVQANWPEGGMIETAWSSSSNIAIVKYWGKHGRQLPRNASLSFTLNEARTDTRLIAKPADGPGGFQFRFEGRERPDFAAKVEKFLGSITDIFPWLDGMRLEMDTRNSFPHSAGIASSASAMSALALCLCELENRLFDLPEDDTAFWRKASYIARLGSGSAARSVYGGVTVWGDSPHVTDSSDEEAVPIQGGIHPSFANARDAILVIRASEKSVSSRAGHALMEEHPMADFRYAQAERHLGQLLPAMASGDWTAFGRCCEAEALSLHALMMSSEPPYLLMAPGTLDAIERVRAKREQEDWPLYFTLDAGPNLHLIYPAAYEDAVQAFIESELRPLCAEGRVIYDRVGQGPRRLE